MMMRSRLWSPEVGTSAGMKSSAATASAEMAAATVFAATDTGASTRVNGLSMKLVRVNSAKSVKTTFVKERRRVFLRVRCILCRSPCELVTSAFAFVQRGRRFLLAHRLRCTGLGATHGGNDQARVSQRAAHRNRN